MGPGPARARAHVWHVFYVIIVFFVVISLSWLWFVMVWRRLVDRYSSEMGEKQKAVKNAHTDFI